MDMNTDTNVATGTDTDRSAGSDNNTGASADPGAGTSMDTGVDMGADTGAGADGGANTGAGISAATGGPANTKAVISVLGRDHKGIVARIATTLTECEANIDDISQTILGKMFSMTMLVTLSEALVPFDTVQERLARDAEALELQITLQRQDVFDFMYKI